MPAAAAILDGMPDARDLHRLDTGGQTMIFAGSVQLFQYAEDDTATRNVAVAVLRQLGFGGAEVAAVMELTPNYVATLVSVRFGKAPRGWPGRRAGRGDRRGVVGPARAWRAAGTRDAEIARRLGVNQSTVLRRWAGARAGGAAARAEPAAAEPGPGEPRAGELPVTEPEEAAGTGLAGPDPARQPVTSLPVCGAMLLHAFFARAAAGTVLADAAAGPGDVALLTAVSMCFALGAATTGQFKHLAAAEAGPLRGLSTLPGLRALRPELARIAGPADPLRLQSLFAAAMRPPALSCPVPATSMTTSSPIRARNRSPRAGTTSAAGPGAAARTRT